MIEEALVSSHNHDTAIDLMGIGSWVTCGIRALDTLEYNGDVIIT